MDYFRPIYTEVSKYRCEATSKRSALVCNYKRDKIIYTKSKHLFMGLLIYISLFRKGDFCRYTIEYSCEYRIENVENANKAYMKAVHLLETEGRSLGPSNVTRLRFDKN